MLSVSGHVLQRHLVLGNLLCTVQLHCIIHKAYKILTPTFIYIVQACIWMQRSTMQLTLKLTVYSSEAFLADAPIVSITSTVVHTRADCDKR